MLSHLCTICMYNHEILLCKWFDKVNVIGCTMQLFVSQYQSRITDTDTLCYHSYLKAWAPSHRNFTHSIVTYLTMFAFSLLNYILLYGTFVTMSNTCYYHKSYFSVRDFFFGGCMHKWDLIRLFCWFVKCIRQRN